MIMLGWGNLWFCIVSDVFLWLEEAKSSSHLSEKSQNFNLVTKPKHLIAFVTIGGSFKPCIRLLTAIKHNTFML